MIRKLLGVFICLLLIFTAIISATGKTNKSNNEDTLEYIINNFDRYPLPPPMSVDMILEESICRRMSIRSYTGEAVTDEELSTILWAAYGVTENGNRSIYNPDGTYSTIIYVIRSDATYKYVPEDHSLSLFKSGNYLYIGQYDTVPIKFGLVWDMDVESDELIGMADIGMIGQNIYFDANALDLGTVTTGGGVQELNDLGLPSNEKPEIIMPLGHLSTPYDFTYDPRPGSNLPEIINNTFTLEDSINNRLISNRWDNMPLSDIEQSQLIWSSYGYSYLYDNINNKWHRTPPSAVGIYPFKIYAADQDGVYEYIPSTHSLSTIIQDDRREEINNSIGSSNMWIDSATWIIIPFYNTDLSPQYLTWWYYENGAIIHNILLEATALSLCANVIYDITNEAGLRSALGISSQTNLIPLSVVPVGNQFSNPNNPPEKPEINGPTSGSAGTSYDFTFNSIDLDGDDVYYYIVWGDGYIEDWEGPFPSGEDFEIAHTYSTIRTYTIEAKAKDIYGDESLWGTFEITIPKSRASTYSWYHIFFDRFPIISRVLGLIKV